VVKRSTEPEKTIRSMGKELKESVSDSPGRGIVIPSKGKAFRATRGDGGAHTESETETWQEKA